MSRQNEIFISSAKSLEKLIKELEQLLDLSFRPEGDLFLHLTELTEGNLWISLYEHDYDNDKDMNFENYDYCLEIEAKGFPSSEKNQSVQRKKSDTIYELLKKSRRFDLLHTNDLQSKIDEFVRT